MAELASNSSAPASSTPLDSRQHAKCGRTSFIPVSTRGVAIGHKTYRRLSDKPRGRRPDIFEDHWEEMARCLEEQPDQTALELLVEFQARYPGCYSSRQLYTLQKRVRAWRQQAVQRLIGEVSLLPPDVTTRHPDLDKRDAVLATVKHAARRQGRWPDGHA